MKPFSERLKHLRGNLTLAEFSSKLGVKLQTYAHYESGRRKPTIKFLLQIVQALNVTSDWLLGLTEDRTTAAAPGTRAPPAAFPPRGLAVAEPPPTLCEGCAYRDKVIRHLLDKLDEQKVGAVGRTQPVRKCTCAPATGKSSLYHG
jgi:transcriptional regulator with XRE-family HTH domain